MHRVERATRRIDRWQQGRPAAAVLYGVSKKFGDDNASTLVAAVAYAGFICLFPLLLVLDTALTLFLSGDPHLQHDLLNSALRQFPVIGTQLGQNLHVQQRTSVIGLVLGLLALVWGTTGLAQAGLFSMSQIWNVPGTDRPNFAARLGRSMAFLLVLGIGVVLSSALAGFGTFGHHNGAVGLVSEALAVAVNAGMYLALFRVLTPSSIATRHLWPGALLGGVGWTILQAAGGYLIGHDLRHDSVSYGVFGLVLGLIAWIYLGARLSLYAAELNSVLARRLWPRGMVQPPLTAADHAAFELLAEQSRHRAEQRVHVSFTAPAMSQEEWGEAHTDGSDAMAACEGDAAVR